MNRSILLPVETSFATFLNMNELLSQFPRVPLAQLPTPVSPLACIADQYHHPELFIKEDDISGTEYGGNKIRKLEFLLGEALDQGCKSVITYGAAGSNHALATAICCRQVGLHPISILAPQEPNDHVRKNILMGMAAGAELHLCGHYREFPKVTRRLSREREAADGHSPYIIPAGGTNATGALGFVNAAFELARQMTPDVIYLPMGTGGTLAGLLVGLRLAGLTTRIEAVRVVDPDFRNRKHIRQLCGELCAKLGIAMNFSDSDIGIRDEFFGLDYGIPTPESQEAVRRFEVAENVYLENTYTGKTAAALLQDLSDGRLEGQSVLFWNTLNSRDFPKEVMGSDYKRLPREFYPYWCID